MKTIKVTDMYECPFKGTREYQLSELTSGIDGVCIVGGFGECELKDCPLKKEGIIKVVWAREE